MIVIFILLALAVGFWLYKIIRLYASIEKYNNYWKARRTEAGDFVYVALGDSAAQAIGATHPKYGYVAKIAASIAQQTGRKVQVINLSKTGATSLDVITTQLDQLKIYTPDLVTVAIGGNDMRTFSRDQFSKNIEKIVDALPAHSYIADAPYFMHGKWERSSVEMRNMVQLYAKSKAMYVVELHDAMMRQGWRSMLNSYAADWFHPNNRGYDIWYQTFWGKIKSTLPKV